MSLLCAVSRDLQYSLIPSFSNHWISAHCSTKSSGRWTCLRYGRNVEVLPTKPQQAAAEQSQTKIAALIFSMTNLKETKIGQELIPDTLQSSLSHNIQLLDAPVWVPVWYTPTFWCFPFCICFHSSGCAMEALGCSKSDKKWGRKISLASFQLLYNSNSFLSPAAWRYRPDLCAHRAESIWIPLLTSAGWSLPAVISLIV